MIFSLKHEYKLRFSFLLAILPNLSYQIYECVREILFSFRSVNNRGEGKRQTQNYNIINYNYNKVSCLTYMAE